MAMLRDDVLEEEYLWVERELDEIERKDDVKAAERSTTTTSARKTAMQAERDRESMLSYRER